MITNKMMKIVLKMKITLQGSSGSPQVHLSAKSEFFPQLLFAAPEVRIVNNSFFIIDHGLLIVKLILNSFALYVIVLRVVNFYVFSLQSLFCCFLIVIHPTFEIRFDLPLCTQSSPSVTTSQTGPWKIQLQLLQYLLHKYLGFIICAMHWVTRSLRMHFQKLEFFKF